MKKTFAITGMTCEHCAKTVERVTKKVAGVLSAEVDLAAARLTVEMEGDLSAAVVEKVEKAGYGARPE